MRAPLAFLAAFTMPAIPAAAEPATIATARFAADATAFLEREITAHVAAVERLDPPPETVLGVPTKGDFTWGSFMRAVTDCSAVLDRREIAGRDLPRFLGQAGLIEARQGGKTFAQLGAALTLRRWGMDLRANPLWRSLTPAEQAEWRGLLDPGRFYDRQTRRLIDLPENYFGVAARIAVINHETGLVPDRTQVDEMLDEAAKQFTGGALYTDDAPPTGRYDRYSQEYARFVYEAAGAVGRKDLQAAVAPALHAVMRTWWHLVSPDGCGYPWGRTIGAISYQDTMEIIGFLATHPEFRPAPLAELAAVYHAAWQWLQRDYQPDRHLLNMFGFGRGNYSYMTPGRQWQQTTAFLSKSADSLRRLRTALEAEGIAEFPAEPALPAVARFEWFRRGDRPAGVWLVRGERLRFALPFTTGPQAGITDYLAAPHALPGFAAPVQQFLPVTVPQLELADGRVLMAADCADEIEPAADGRSVRAVWRRWVAPGGEPAKFTEPGLTAEVVWRIDGDTLRRTERITAVRPVAVRRFQVLVPATSARVVTRFESGRRVDRFESTEGALEVSADAGRLPLAVALEATKDTAAGKGTRGPIPLLLRFEAGEFTVTPEQPLAWSLDLRRPVN